MLRTSFNLGLNLTTWISFLTAVILIYATYFFARYLTKIHKIKFPKQTQKRALKTIHSTVLFAALVIFLYFAFGKGKPLDITPAEQDGMRQLTEQMPEELSLEHIKEDMEKKKPESLKQVERGDAKEEQENADDYLKKALERAKKRERSTH